MRTILVCTNVDCAERGSADVLSRFEELEDSGEHDVEVRDYLCFSACEKGPNVVCVEDSVWYCGVQPDDVAEIGEKHLCEGIPVARLTENTDATTRNLIFIVLEAGLLPGSIG
ncbi:MAG: (2Fe-2S) ferredoxin domain-containing protein [Acidimicrobiia bacterium]